MKRASATPAAPTTSNDMLLVALMARKSNTTSRLSELVSDSAGSVVRGTTEVLSRSFGGVGHVWDAGLVTGEVDGACYARDMLARAAKRNRLSTEQMAALIAASSDTPS